MAVCDGVEIRGCGDVVQIVNGGFEAIWRLIRVYLEDEKKMTDRRFRAVWILYAILWCLFEGARVLLCLWVMAYALCFMFCFLPIYPLASCLPRSTSELFCAMQAIHTWLLLA